MIPVTVRLSNPNVDVHITNKVAGLTWRSVVPGGYASATFALQQPILFTSPMLAPFTRVYIYDARSGDTLWEGRLQMAGRSAGDQGQVWALTAIGPSGHTLDETAPLIYVDFQLDRWERSVYDSGLMSPSATAGAGAHPLFNSVDVVLCAYPSAVPVNTNSRSSAVYQGFVGSGMELGALGFVWDAGFQSTWNAECIVGVAPNNALAEIVFTAPVNTTGGPFAGSVGSDWAPGRDVVSVRLRRTGGGLANTSGDATWASFQQIRVLGRRMDKAGNLLTGAAMLSTIGVHASWVVADLVGRMLPQYDGANALIDAFDTVSIDQLCYPDGVTSSQVLDDLMKLEPNTYWAAWESNAEGKYRFEWVHWPTEVRYEASVEDGFDSPAPSFEVYNRVKVRYRDARGRILSLPRSQPIESLDKLGIVREHFEDISDEIGSPSNALAVATTFLDDHKDARSGGTLTLNSPVRDLILGQQVSPWAIKPGQLITLRGIEASHELTGPATRDGLTTFRIVSVEVNSDGAATLELDMFTPSETRALVDLANRRNRKR